MRKETKLQREIRLKGFTQKEFAEEINTTTVAVSGWVNNRILISGRMVRVLRNAGISQDAIENPAEIVKN